MAFDELGKVSILKKSASEQLVIPELSQAEDFKPMKTKKYKKEEGPF